MKVNQHTSHPSAFISSTFVDLQDERASVAEALKDNGLNVNALDIKPATNNTSKTEILKGIRESDFVILIIGDRFGSIVPKITESSSISVTWWEYKKAIALGKPVIAFFQNSDYFNTDYHDSRSDKDYLRKRKLFERFKSLITEKHNLVYFTDSYELSEKVEKSLISTYRAGVEQMNRKNSLLNQTISRLEAENEELKHKLAIAQKPKPNPFSGGILGGLGNLSK
jgi:nucleoside 2-deoxyribosyltransferase